MDDHGRSLEAILQELRERDRARCGCVRLGFGNSRVCAIEYGSPRELSSESGAARLVNRADANVDHSAASHLKHRQTGGPLPFGGVLAIGLLQRGHAGTGLDRGMFGGEATPSFISAGNVSGRFPKRSIRPAGDETSGFGWSLMRKLFCQIDDSLPSVRIRYAQKGPDKPKPLKLSHVARTIIVHRTAFLRVLVPERGRPHGNDAAAVRRPCVAAPAWSAQVEPIPSGRISRRRQPHASMQQQPRSPSYNGKLRAIGKPLHTHFG